MKRKFYTNQQKLDDLKMVLGFSDEEDDEDILSYILILFKLFFL